MIIKQDQNSNVKRHQQAFKCMVYKDLDRPFQNTHSNSIINPTNNLIHLSLSDDELCRDFYANSNNFILRKKKKEGVDTIVSGLVEQYLLDPAHPFLSLLRSRAFEQESSIFLVSAFAQIDCWNQIVVK